MVTLDHLCALGCLSVGVRAAVARALAHRLGDKAAGFTSTAREQGSRRTEAVVSGSLVRWALRTIAARPTGPLTVPQSAADRAIGMADPNRLETYQWGAVQVWSLTFGGGNRGLRGDAPTVLRPGLAVGDFLARREQALGVVPGSARTR
ncbi:hypothetical protein [Nocardia alni]|uniref:hypothetical protein n=1 Tax=Nocardia alni TaxID=2815723 RepID=UPI001C2138BA|nr:hypothetical protein [Nocardia alni]